MKRAVIIFIDWFYPAFKAGGPIKSVFNIIEAISDKFDFTVVTSNRDADGFVLDVKVNCQINRDKYSIYYLNESADRKKIYEGIIKNKQPEIVYYNSMFSVSYTIKPLLYFQAKTKAKNIIAPRGMLGAGALAIKPMKKKIFLGLAKFLLFKNITWHTSTEQETAEVKSVFGERANTFVAQNISSPINKRKINGGFKNKEELRLVFISRMSGKKNLIYILQILGSLKELKNLKIDIFGPIEDKIYWKRCLKYIALDDRISYKGVLSPNEVNDTLSKYHFYVLASFNENYGHSIVESINIGVPVIISDQTPWRGLEEKEVGFDLSLQNEYAWQEKIKYAYLMDNNTYKKWVISCYSFAQKTFINKDIINSNIDLFLSN
ncbi:glycosyltransferase [Vicingaceae bacterium]|nr:glycosyltransferase [Vicingaceae bacterium]